MFQFRGMYVPERMMEGIQLYLEYGIEPGSFLASIICNDLKEAVGRADDENLQNIPAFVAWFYNEAPSQSWGSPEKMKNWMRERRAIREKSKQESAAHGDKS